MQDQPLEADLRRRNSHRMASGPGQSPIDVSSPVHMHNSLDILFEMLRIQRVFSSLQSYCVIQSPACLPYLQISHVTSPSQPSTDMLAPQLSAASLDFSIMWHLQEQAPLDTKEKGWIDLLNPRYRWIMLLTTLLPLFQQLSGINTCILYSSEVRHRPTTAFLAFSRRSTMAL